MSLGCLGTEELFLSTDHFAPLPSSSVACQNILGSVENLETDKTTRNDMCRARNQVQMTASC